LENIYFRDYVIPNNLVGQDVFIYNGKFFQQLHVREQHVGYKFGEFSITKFFKNKVIKDKRKRIRKK
jgi:ribosomal protein S19